MGKKTPKAPAAPDPMATAAAQGAWNSSTAMQQQAMNMVGQNSPWGSLSYEQTGSTVIQSPNGPINVPQYTANTTLSPEQQAIFDQTQAAEGNMATLANEQSAKLKDYLNTPFSFDNQDATNWAYDLGAQRLDPRFKQQEEALRSQLVNSGIRPGTPAYEREMTRLSESKNDAYNQLMLQGRGQAFGEATAIRSQPINELTALLSGSQVQNPNATFAQTPQSQVAGVDYTGLVNQKFGAEMNAYNQKIAQNQGMMGGLFGLGGSLISMFSDARLKSDIKRVGELDNGMGVYLYRMDDGAYQIGLIAQEVQEAMPHAVVDDPSGFLKVRYDLATEAL